MKENKYGSASIFFHILRKLSALFSHFKSLTILLIFIANILTFFNKYKSEHIMFKMITGHSLILMNIATCYVFTYV